MNATSEQPDLHAQRVNDLLAQWRAGDTEAFNQLFTTLHQELRTIAHRHFLKERADHTLQTDDLISKLYIKLLGSKTIPWTDYSHFLRSTARVMRQLLIDHARGWQRRPTGKIGVPLPEPGQGEAALMDPLAGNLERMTAVSQALDRMAEQDPRMAEIADLRLVLGLTLEEIAACLELPIMKVKREWLIAKKVLAGELT